MAIVVPTVNEAGTIGKLIAELLSIVPKVRIYVVDDASTDGTAQIVKGLAREWDSVVLLERPERRGLGDALRFGLGKALSDRSNEAFVTMDADLSHDPSDLHKLLSEHVDLVIGSRYVSGGEIVGWSLFRRLTSAVANRLSRICLGIQTKDATSGYRMYSRRAADLVVSCSVNDGFQFQVEATWLIERANIEVKEVPIRFRDRELGRSKLKIVREVTSTLAFLLSARRIISRR